MPSVGPLPTSLRGATRHEEAADVARRARREHSGRSRGLVVRVTREGEAQHDERGRRPAAADSAGVAASAVAASAVASAAVAAAAATADDASTAAN